MVTKQKLIHILKSWKDSTKQLAQRESTAEESSFDLTHKLNSENYCHMLHCSHCHFIVAHIRSLTYFSRYDSKYRETQQRMEELGLMEQSPILHLDEWEIPRENIVLNRKLGEGAFGAVCGGEVMGIGGDGEWVPVAVKSLKIGSLPEDKVCIVIFSSPRSNETHLQKLKDLINARGVYVSIGVQAGALNR